MSAPSRVAWHQRLRVRLLALAIGATLPFLLLEIYHARQKVTRERLATMSRMQGIARLVAARADERFRVTEALTIGVGLALRDRPEPERVQRMLRTAIDGSAVHLSDLSLLAPDGTLIASARTALGRVPGSARARDYFRRAIAERRVVVSVPYRTGQLLGRPRWAVTIARPIYDANEQLLGVLSAPTELDSLSDLTTQPGLPRGAVVTIIDTLGAVVARNVGGSDAVGRDLRGTPLFDTLRAHPTGDLEGLDGDSVRRVIGYAHATLAPWAVTVSVPWTNVTANALRDQRTDVATLVAASLLAMAVALLLGSLVVRPIDALTRDARRLAVGEPPQEARPAGPAEVALLADAFRDMAAQIAQRTTALADSEARYRQLFNATPTPMWGWTLSTHRIVAVNDATVRHFGFDRDQLMRMTVEDLLVPAELERFAKRLAVAPVHEPRHVGTWRQRRADGEEVETEIFGTPMLFGDEACVLNVGIDVTEQRAAARALAKSEEQLRQSQKMEAVGQLAGGVAHDFNNLLTSILGHCELILGATSTDDDTRAEVREIQATARRAAELTRQILIFSRKQVVSPTVIDPVDVVHDLERLLARVLGEDLQLTVRAESGVGRIRMGRGQLEQVLVNLATNARDAMTSGGALRIEVSTPPTDGSDPAVDIVVTDTGVGMSPAVRDRVFEPFFTTKPRGRGTGLGLTMVYGIVQQAGGTIRIESTEGNGTSVRLRFPVSEAAVGSSGAHLAIDGSAPRGAGEHILLAEDDQAVRQVAEALLRRHGYDVTVATDGEVALALMEEHGAAIQLVISDVIMPRMNGRELAERILRRFPGTRILFVSGYTDDDILRRGALANDIDLLEKPFTAFELLSRVRRALDDRLAT
jgi:two-component system, cell cycle sensor histidine kinase and response regulator CckA